MPAGPTAIRSGRLRRAAALVRACHPEPTALVTVLTSLLALGAGRGLGTVWVAAAVLAGQLSVGWMNDYLDRHLDQMARRRDKPLVTQNSNSLDTDLVKGEAGHLTPTTVRTAAVIALGSAVPLSLASGLGFTTAHLAAIGCAMAYNAGLKATWLSVLPYAAAFGLLPTAVALGLPTPRLPPTWAVAAGALIGAGGHFTQALPDIPTDRRLGIRGLPQILGQRVSGAMAAILLLAANLFVAFGPGHGTAIQVVGLALAATSAILVLLATLALRPKLAFRLTLATAAITVLAFLASGSSLATGPSV